LKFNRVTVGFIGPTERAEFDDQTIMVPVSAAGELGIFANRPFGGGAQPIGYLPEVSLYYPFMKAREVLELTAWQA